MLLFAHIIVLCVLGKMLLLEPTTGLLIFPTVDSILTPLTLGNLDPHYRFLPL